MELTVAYETHSNLITGFDGSQLGFAANLQRPPVAFRGKVLDPVPLRQLMIAMHEVILSDYTVERSSWLLDPVITVHPDELCFEAFSNDGSSYVRLTARQSAFEAVGTTPTYGTTNIDFTFALRDALQNLRSSRRTDFTVGPSGFGVQTSEAMRRANYFEQKVDLPDSWVKGFLQVQSALVMKPFTFDVRPVDLLNLIATYLEVPKSRPPYGLRYFFKQNQPISATPEGFDQGITFHGTEYKGYDRVIRVWGRKRLELLQRVLPYADKVTIGLVGRGLPHFYACHCGPYIFTLVLSGWSQNDWSASGALDLLAPTTPIDAEQIATVYNVLVQHFSLNRADIEAYTLLSGAQVEAALFRLCREGRAMYDPVYRRYRLRELFAVPLDFAALLAPDARIEKARGMAATEGVVTLHSVGQSDTRPREIKILATVRDGEREFDPLVAIDRDSRIRFAQCTCDFFKTNLMSLGPCEHILAARFAAEPQLQQVEKEAIIPT
jgi:predicted nucleic acid-binding Zn finger protein